jgi:hypothetical protein
MVLILSYFIQNKTGEEQIKMQHKNKGITTLSTIGHNHGN